MTWPINCGTMALPSIRLHGDRPQWERTKVMNAFKNGQLRMLIATDVAARGLDVKDVGVVVNFDMPAGVNAVEDYVHRIGRTGRAGPKGSAHTFFTQGDRKCARQLVEVLNKAGQDVPDELQAMVPRFQRGGGWGRGGGRGSGRGRWRIVDEDTWEAVVRLEEVVDGLEVAEAEDEALEAAAEGVADGEDRSL